MRDVNIAAPRAPSILGFQPAPIDFKRPRTCLALALSMASLLTVRSARAAQTCEQCILGCGNPGASAGNNSAYYNSCVKACQGHCASPPKSSHLTPSAMSVGGISVHYGAGIYLQMGFTCAVGNLLSASGLYTPGAVECWGYDVNNELGSGLSTQEHKTGYSVAPVVVAGLSGPATAIASGQRMSCALLASGAVQCWGYGLTGTQTVPLSAPATSIAMSQLLFAGADYGDAGCAVLSTGAVQCYFFQTPYVGAPGLTPKWQLWTVVGLPSPVPGAIGVLGGGLGLACVSAGTGLLQADTFCWPMAPPYGSWASPFISTAIRVAGISGVLSRTIALDSAHGCVNYGVSVVCQDWTVNYLPPQTVVPSGAAYTLAGAGGAGSSPQRVVSIAAGYLGSCAVTAAGQVLCWNWDATAATQVALLRGTPSAIATNADQEHWCVLDGETVKCWGGNMYGGCGVPASSSPITTPVTVPL